MLSDRVVRKMAVNVFVVYLGFGVSTLSPVLYPARAGLLSSIAINVSILASLAVFCWLGYAAHISPKKSNSARTEAD